MTIESGNRYYIINKKAGTAVDLDTRNYKTVQGWSRHEGTNQQWDFTRVDDGWQIRNAQQGTYLAYGGGVQDGERIICRSEPYSWNIWPDERDKNAYRICVANTKQNIDLSDNGNRADGTAVQLWSSWEGTNQAWYVERVQ